MKEQLLKKWVARFKYTTILTIDYFEMCKDLETNNIDFDIFYSELNTRCFDGM